MPMYDYECTSCGKKWANVNSVKTRLDERCSSCQGQASILITAPAVLSGHSFGFSEQERSRWKDLPHNKVADEAVKDGYMTEWV